MSHPADPPPYTPGPAPYTQGSAPAPGIQVIHVQPAPTHYIATPVPIGQPVGSSSAIIVCQYCNHQIITKLEVRPSVRTHLWAVCLLLLGCWPCMCIPYCTPACMNVDHYCPNCNALVGKYQH